MQSFWFSVDSLSQGIKSGNDRRPSKSCIVLVSVCAHRDVPPAHSLLPQTQKHTHIQHIYKNIHTQGHGHTHKHRYTFSHKHILTEKQIDMCRYIHFFHTHIYTYIHTLLHTHTLTHHYLHTFQKIQSETTK